MRKLVIIPTYNEKENIENILRYVFKLEPKFDVLVIEDNSPDGTAQIVKRLQSEFPQLHMIERRKARTRHGLYHRIQMVTGTRVQLHFRDGCGFLP